jgi:hypothetical protein
MTAWTKSKMGTRFSDHDDRMKEGSNTRWKERCSRDDEWSSGSIRFRQRLYHKEQRVIN